MDHGEVAIWMALIGFDRDKEDRGASEYLDHLGFTPSAISLFVQNPDMMFYHDMKEEHPLPADCCNYYGAMRNEIREIQPWTNYDLRTLAAGLKARGVETYLGFMGNHLAPLDESDDSTVPVGMFGYPAKIDFLLEHKELVLESTMERGYLTLFKRFADGSSFEDFFIEQALKTLRDYDIDGIHFADSLFPPCIAVKNGDFSDDVLGQFVAQKGAELPAEILFPLTDPASPGIKARAEYVWAHCRSAWITFYAERWQQFFFKCCKAFHAAGKKVMVNNSWTSEPFESLYRFGIDYKLLEEAGVDIICVENQATTQLASDGGRYKIHEHMLMPAVMKAYAPKIKTLAFNFARDSTEENSALDHFPTATERELCALASTLYVGKETTRAVDGYFVCLGDGVRREEWNWLNKRYDVAYSGNPVQPLTPTLVWSDGAVFPYLEEYIANRRWSTHRIAADMSRKGAKCSAVVRADNLEGATGTLFAPNVDLMSDAEKQALLAYRKGAVIFTSTAARKERFEGFSQAKIQFEDRFVRNPEARMCAGILGGEADEAEIHTLLEEDDGSEITDCAAVRDNDFWFYDLPFNKVSSGFLKALAGLLARQGNPYFALESMPKTYDIFSATGPSGENAEVFTAHRMDNGRIRIILENDSPVMYRQVRILFRQRVKRIINVMNFPVVPLKLVLQEGVRAYGKEYDAQLARALGCVAKIPPAGVQMIELEIENDETETH